MKDDKLRISFVLAAMDVLLYHLGKRLPRHPRINYDFFIVAMEGIKVCEGEKVFAIPIEHLEMMGNWPGYCVGEYLRLLLAEDEEELHKLIKRMTK